MKTYKQVFPTFCRTGRIGDLYITEPSRLLPISPSVISESIQTFKTRSGVVTAQLMIYGDNWRFWVVVD